MLSVCISDCSSRSPRPSRTICVSRRISCTAGYGSRFGEIHPWKRLMQSQRHHQTESQPRVIMRQYFSSRESASLV